MFSQFNTKFLLSGFPDPHIQIKIIFANRLKIKTSERKVFEQSYCALPVFIFFVRKFESFWLEDEKSKRFHDETGWFQFWKQIPVYSVKEKTLRHELIWIITWNVNNWSWRVPSSHFWRTVSLELVRIAINIY